MPKALMKRDFWRQVLWDLEHNNMDLERASSGSIDFSNEVEVKRCEQATEEIKVELRRKCRMEG